VTSETIQYFEYSVNAEQGRIAYRHWSSETKSGLERPTLICAHGVSQNSRHLSELARRLVGDFDIIVPDFPGRGLSDEFFDKLHYDDVTYAPVFQAFLDGLGLSEVYWLGTSMGGLTGITLASRPDTPIKKLVLNDIGPIIPVNVMQLLARVGKNTGASFATFEDALDVMKNYLTNFGMTDPAMMEAYVRASLRQGADGIWRYDYDSEIYAYTRELPELNERELPFWQFWSTVTCPVLVLHGVNSTTLTPEIITRMRETRADIDVIDVPDTGHAPHLMNDEQAGWIRQWLLRS